MTAQGMPLYTPQEYLALERAADYKSEYYRGEIFAKAGATRAHNLIAANVAGLLWAAFRGGPCRVSPSDQRIGVEATGSFAYPDVSAICEEDRFSDDDRNSDTLVNPLLLVEVLSPSTEAYDRGKKFANYQQIPSLQEYVLVSQTEPRVESFRRQPDGATWLLTTADGLASTISLTSVGCDLALAEVYEKVAFPEIEQSVVVLAE